jgi:2-phospho-L-lactate transferase/gluconeogenesis factor (CofD/UPF0052 family)
MLNVVILNGGRGAATLIPAFLARQGLHVTSVVNAYDDGKSTGEIRRYFGMLGPSDIRKVQELMLPEDDPDHESNRALFGYRFPLNSSRDSVVAQLRGFASGSPPHLVGMHFQSKLVRISLRSLIKEFLDGLETVEPVVGEPFNFSDVSIMNCIYAGAFLMFGRDIEQATLFIDRLFKLRGIVLPTSIEDKKLLAIRENGRILYNEAEIVELRSNIRIERVYLLDRYVDQERFETLTREEKRRYLDHHHCPVRLSSGVELALRQADIVVYSAGTQHSSLYPTYMTTGLARTIAYNKGAYKVFVTNIGADYETPDYESSDYIRHAYRYLNSAELRPYAMQDLFDVILINKSNFKSSETYVRYDEERYADIPIPRRVDAFESATEPGKHDGVKVIGTILELYETARSAEMASENDAHAPVVRISIPETVADLRL